MPLSSPLQEQAYPVEAATLRRVCGLFVTGVAVVTSGAGDRATGTTVNSFTSVSLDPPLVLFCLHYRSRLHEVLNESGSFAVNLLGGMDESTAWAFAGRPTEAAARVKYDRTGGDIPILRGTLGYLACTIEHVYPGGDHAIIVGRVVALGTPRRLPPLLFFEGAFGVLMDEVHGGHPILDG